MQCQNSIVILSPLSAAAASVLPSAALVSSAFAAVVSAGFAELPHPANIPAAIAAANTPATFLFIFFPPVFV